MIVSYTVRTQDGRYWSVRANDGAITSEIWRTPHAASWRVVGVSEARPFGRVRPVPDWRAILAAGAPPFSNGSPRYRIVDIDHGTRRLWGSGIVAAWPERVA